MFSAAYLDHFERPRNQGRLADATHTGQAQDATCGDRLWLDLRVVDGVIEAARFRVQGCSGSIAAGSALAEALAGRVARPEAITRHELAAVLGGLPAGKRHALRLALRALTSALAADPTP